METINENSKFFFIINPKAGNVFEKREWGKIEKLLYNEAINYDYSFTEHIGHAQQIVIEKINLGYRKFVVLGGDGTLNEVINGIFKQKNVPTNEIYIGLFCLGTGNDWAKYYNFTHDYNESIKRLKNEKYQSQDIGKIAHYINGQKQESFFINVAGTCFEAVVVNETNKMKTRGHRNKTAYLWALLKSLFSYKSWKLKIFINNQSLEGKFLSISIGNGKYSGGGMMQAPNAIIDDGQFDVVLYSNMTKLKMILNVKNLYNGKIHTVKGIEAYRTDSLTIEVIETPNCFAQMDGEIIYGTKYEFSMLHKAINVMI